MSHFVYVLFSKNFNKIYIGYTHDLEKRFESHNRLATKGWTIKFRPLILIYSEKFADKKDALILEKQLKTAKGRTFIWEMINNEKT
jgi:putative endonuclease